MGWFKQMFNPGSTVNRRPESTDASVEQRARKQREDAKVRLQEARVTTTDQIGAAHGVQAIEDQALDIIRAAQRATQSGDHRRAIGLYQKAIAIEPNSVDAHNALAGAFLSVGQIDSAITEYKAAIKGAPSYLQDKVQEIYTNIGNAILNRRTSPTAIDEFETAVEGLPRSSGYHCARAVIYYRLKDYKHARPAAQEVLRIEAHGTCAQCAQQILTETA